MKKMLFVLFFTITSLQLFCQEVEWVLQVPIAETNLCVALHNEIKASSSLAIQSYVYPGDGSLTFDPRIEDVGELFCSCLAVCHAHHNNALSPVSEAQLHTLIVVMTRSAESSYQEVVVKDTLGNQALATCLRALGKRSIVTPSHSDSLCPQGYTILCRGSLKEITSQE